MPHDVDIARVAAVLNAPGLRYRSFGNGSVRTPTAPPDNVTLTNTVLNGPGTPEPPAPVPFRDPSPTMTLIAEGLSGRAAQLAQPAPFAALPALAPQSAVPAWPLLEGIGRPPEDASGRGTLARLFETVPAAAPSFPPAAPLAAPAAAAPAAMPGFLPVAAPPPIAAPAAAAPVAPPAAVPPLVPAARVTTPLAEVFQALARGVASPQSPFSGLRLPGAAAGSR